MARRYRRKPVMIEAEQFQGNLWACDPRGVCRELGHGIEDCGNGSAWPHLHTMHKGQVVRIEPGDWVLPEPDGEHFYPCKPDIFASTYEEVE